MKSLKDFYKDKNILVTGGAGFIGSHLVEELIKYEANVTVLDNLSTGNLNNLYKVISQINLLYGDITNSFTCRKATSNKDIVFHLAALTSVTYSIQNPKICKKINIIGTQNLLDGCKFNEIKKFIFSSSAAVYGNKNDKCSENDIPKPESPYAQSKLESEKICKQYSNEHKIQTTILRYFNVYGDRQNPNGDYAAVIAKFRDNLKKQKPIVIFGDGKQTRDFIHVSKIVNANLKIAMQENLNGEIINVASGESINLLELLEQLEKEMKTKNVDIKFKPSRTGDINQSFADCSKCKRLLNL